MDDAQPNYPPHDKDKSPNYVAWAIAVAVGVIIAYMAIRQYEIHQATQIMKQIGASAEQQFRAINNQTQAQLKQFKIQQQAQLIADQERRAGDPTGAKLNRQCGEWTRTTEQMKSEFAMQEKNRFCAQFAAYVTHSTHPRP